MESSLLSALSISFLLVAMLTPILIWALRSLKLTQPIRIELPPDHQAKRGTPLMAGIILLIGVITSTYFHPKPLVLFLGATFVLFGLLGFMDDFKKAAFQDPSGISSSLYFILQCFDSTETYRYAAFPSFVPKWP
jgi:phospho-N-acetylmuramoyl-pentapeptide-transferase